MGFIYSLLKCKTVHSVVCIFSVSCLHHSAGCKDARRCINWQQRSLSRSPETDKHSEERRVWGRGSAGSGKAEWPRRRGQWRTRHTAQAAFFSLLCPRPFAGTRTTLKPHQGIRLLSSRGASYSQHLLHFTSYRSWGIRQTSYFCGERPASALTI